MLHRFIGVLHSFSPTFGLVIVLRIEVHRPKVFEYSPLSQTTNVLIQGCIQCFIVG